MKMHRIDTCLASDMYKIHAFYQILSKVDDAGAKIKKKTGICHDTCACCHHVPALCTFTFEPILSLRPVYQY